MKPFIKLFMPLVLFTFLLSSCQKEEPFSNSTIEQNSEVDTEVIEYNPLVSRVTSIESDGLEYECFIILFPFNLIDSEEISYTVDNQSDFDNLISDSDLYIIDFEYPINVETEDGNVVSLDSGEELASHFAECVPDGGWTEDLFPAYEISYENSCFELVYPLSLINLNTARTNSVEFF